MMVIRMSLKSLFPIILVLFCLLSTAYCAQDKGGFVQEAKVIHSDVQMVYQEEAYTKADLRRIRGLLEDAKTAYKNREYGKANELLNQAIESLSVLEEPVKPVKTGWADEDSAFFGVEGVIPPDAFYRSFLSQDVFTHYIKDFVDIGITNFSVDNGPNWQIIEPSPPKNGRHFYTWRHMDDYVRNFHNQGGKLLLLHIRPRSNWGASEMPKGSPRQNSAGYSFVPPPKPGYWDDYGEFVQAVVERYDKDGVDDMPGLKHPLLYYQIESEASSHWTRAGWDVKDYIKLLEISYEYIKRANPEAKVLASSFNFADAFDDNPSPQKLESLLSDPQVNRNVQFVREVFRNNQFYDIVSVHFLGDYTGLPGQMEWIKSQMREFNFSKPVWGTDTTSTILLGQNRFQKAKYRNDRSIRSILDDENHSRHEEVSSWWQSEQAILTAKQFVVGAEAGVQKIFISRTFEIPSRLRPRAPDPGWGYLGLLNYDGTPRPVYHTMKLLVQKLEGFRSVEKLNIGNDIWAYKFMVSGKPVYVLWTEKEEKTVPLAIDSDSIQITHLITGKRETRPRTEMKRASDGRFMVQISSSPIFIEKR